MKKILRGVIFLSIVGAIIGGSAYYFNTIAVEEDGGLQASGTIEAVQITIAPEMGGRVKQVLVSEGEPVAGQQVLVRLDTSLLEAQLHQAESALSIANANYALVAAGTTQEQQQAAIAAANLELLAARQALDALYDHADLAAAQALLAVANAEKGVDNARRTLDTLHSEADPADVDAAYANMILARDQLDKAQEAFDRWKNKPEDNVIRASFQSSLAQAQQVYDAAVRKYNNLTGTTSELDLSQAEANLTLAQAQLEEAKKNYAILKDGPDPDDVALAKARITNAKAQLALAQSETPTQEQLAVAQSQVDAARTNLEAIQIQLEKMTITAPTEGVVLSRLIEPGEIALPNSPLLTIARLDDLTITVFVPEDRYGEITLGQATRIRIDSFPDEVFTGKVIFIADKAEFTPRNVQTAEGRKTTVFAVKISVDDSSGRLKPGMPADVIFSGQ